MDTVAFEKGRVAFLDGYSDDTNPYHYRTQAHEDWLQGWDSEHSKHFHEVEMDARDRILDDPRRGQARG